MKVGLALCLLVLALCAGALMEWDRMLGYLETPGPGDNTEVVVMIPKDFSPENLAALLHQRGLVAKPGRFEWYLTQRSGSGTVPPGEYAFRPSMSPVEMVSKLEGGAVLTRDVTIRAGMRSTDIFQELQKLGIASANALEKARDDAQLIESLKIEGPSLEGFLFPGTYRLSSGMSPAQILKIFVDGYRTIVPPSLLATAKERGMSEYALVTLASLVEVEPLPDSERGMLSRLYQNRLSKKRPLENKASVAYGLRKPIEQLADTDYVKPHDWNTFLKLGLPKTPIASPSLGALSVTASPPPADALFYANTPDGTTVFCPDEACVDAVIGGHRDRFRRGRRPEPVAPSGFPDEVER